MVDVVKKILRPYITVFSHLFKRPHTIMYPYERLEFSERYRGRHTLCLDGCTGCGVCRMVCPNDAIELVPVEGSEKKHPQINYGRCSFCGLCTEFCRLGSLRLTDLVEISTTKREHLIYSPHELARLPAIKDVLPELKRRIKMVIVGSNIRYFEEGST